MAEAENCRGECGGGLLVDITAKESDRKGSGVSLGSDKVINIDLRGEMNYLHRFFSCVYEEKVNQILRAGGESQQLLTTVSYTC